MNNRNVLLFVIGSMVLLGGQFWLSSRYAKPAPVVQPQQAAPKATEAPAPVPPRRRPPPPPKARRV
ncbi:MAG: hypothetical protein IPO28_04575 [Holophagaceae bacterium]|nr:hypothetical protein [Holophagaceae bacterium]